MNDSLSARVLNAMLYDVLQAAIMLLFLLSSAATNRRFGNFTWPTSAVYFGPPVNGPLSH